MGLDLHVVRSEHTKRNTSSWSGGISRSQPPSATAGAMDQLLWGLDPERFLDPVETKKAEQDVRMPPLVHKVRNGGQVWVTENGR